MWRSFVWLIKMANVAWTGSKFVITWASVNALLRSGTPSFQNDVATKDLHMGLSARRLRFIIMMLLLRS